MSGRCRDCVGGGPCVATATCPAFGLGTSAVAPGLDCCVGGPVTSPITAVPGSTAMFVAKTAILPVLANGGNAVGRAQPCCLRGVVAVCCAAFGRINAAVLLVYAKSGGRERFVHGG